LIGLSLQAARVIDSDAENAYSTELTQLLNKLYFGDKEAVAEGFTTTFGNIKGAINGLAKQSFHDGNNAEQTEAQKLSHASNGQLAQPPVWIVMPYTSMIDGGYSNMSGLINSLSAQLPQPFAQNSLIPPQIASIGKKEPESRQEPVQQEQVAENKEENKQQVINEEDKKEDVVNEEAAIQEEPVKVESVIQEEPIKVESAIQEAPAKEESVIQEAPVKEEEPPMNEERPETPHVVDETVEDEKFADADPDEIGDIPGRSSPFDCFSELNSDGLSIPKENTTVPNSPASTSFSNLVNDDTKTSTQSSTESKLNAEDMASAGWKNFRAPDQTNRKSNTSAKKSQRR
jgi:hypothetical protein